MFRQQQQRESQKVTLSNPAKYEQDKLEEYDIDTLYNIISWQQRDKEKIRDESLVLVRHHVRLIAELLDEITELKREIEIG